MVKGLGGDFDLTSLRGFPINFKCLLKYFCFLSPQHLFILFRIVAPARDQSVDFRIAGKIDLIKPRQLRKNLKVKDLLKAGNPGCRRFAIRSLSAGVKSLAGLKASSRLSSRAAPEA